jgi:exopolyphosphatase/guanosine-5'-triphosphate,3'-diphosphate pyrophosphatase
MAKITTIIDIGSNSMRMVVFKKTSRFAFHLINETKSKVKISENCYENGGNLQEIPMQRAYNALESFLNIAKNLKSRKILCVATSALRDAPNSKVFLDKVKKNLKLNIKIINGEKESYFGGIAAQNLLNCDNFTTVDIGGGSTEFALVQNNTITKTISLNIGTVRLKELFFDKEDYIGAKGYLLTELEKLPAEYKTIDTIVGLGGTARALSRMIIKNLSYPLDTLHGFEYKTDQAIDYFSQIIDAKTNEELSQIGIRKDRFDTIKTGTFIFKTILEYLQIHKVVTSGVGVREGVYLNDLLRNSNGKFPTNFQVSVRSLLDRFIDDKKQTAYLGNNIVKVFDTLKPLHNVDDKYKSYLVIAAKLQQIGISLNFYKNAEHSSNFILDGLNYGFTHQERLLIATIIKYSRKPLPTEKNIKEFKELLPPIEVLQWLSYIHSLNKVLNGEFVMNKFEYSLNDNTTFTIQSNKNHYIIQRTLLRLEKPKAFDLTLQFHGNKF